VKITIIFILFLSTQYYFRHIGLLSKRTSFDTVPEDGKHVPKRVILATPSAQTRISLKSNAVNIICM
jgi:hypothetical protein